MNLDQKTNVELAEQLWQCQREIGRMEKVLKTQRKAARKVSDAIIGWMDANKLDKLQISDSLWCCIHEKKKKVGLSASEKKDKLEEWILAKGMSTWEEYNQFLIYCNQQQKEELVRVLVFESSLEPPLKKVKRTTTTSTTALVEQVD